MARPKTNRIPICIKLDVELNEILNRKKVAKSDIINFLLWKYLGMQNNMSLNSSRRTLFSAL
jgi:hypothetical protein